MATQSMDVTLMDYIRFSLLLCEAVTVSTVLKVKKSSFRQINNN